MGGLLPLICLCSLAAPPRLLPAGLQAQAAGLALRIAEVARSLDLSRGQEEFLTITVEISGADPARLRRVQPQREDFRVLAGKRSLPCHWLRGGSLPEDPRRLRFTLGFSVPPKEIRRVSLIASLPRLEGEEALEVRLTGLKPGTSGQELKGPGWSLTVTQFGEKEYLVPSLPSKGHFISKGGPVDARVFRKSAPSDPVPDRAIVLAFHSRDLGLYDPTLDVSGYLLVDGAPSTPLISALMRRDPSRAVQSPPYAPFVQGEFHFRVPARGQPTGAVIRFDRRPPHPESETLRLDGLPVPGSL